MKRLIWVLTLALVGCGDANTGSNGTGSIPLLATASGPVTSLGPLGVAGVRLDEGAATVLVNANASRPATDLRLGMFADAEGLATPSDGTGTASTAVAQSVVKGPITAIDASRGSLQVMGVPVRVDANTLFQEMAGLHEVGIGSHVEVHGLRLPGSEGTLATRLTYRAESPPSAAEVLGGVSDFSAGPPVIATAGPQIDYTNAQFSIASPAGLQPVPPGVAALPAGAQVRVSGSYDPASNLLSATRVTALPVPERTAGRLVYVEGFVLSRVSTHYQVGDVSVDPTQIGATLAVGSRVRVRGVMASGSLRADQVAVVDPGVRIEYVVEGPVIVGTFADFYVRGERIDASQAAFSGGTAASIAPGQRVRVKGVAGPGKLTATEVVVL